VDKPLHGSQEGSAAGSQNTHYLNQI